jgi:uncharacterized protein with NRDE domain
MCTLLLLHRCVVGAPLVVAANRDEYLDRPAAPPALSAGGPMAWVAPADLRAGGTWLGVNAAGVFAGLTNRPTTTPDPSRRSRGLLVLDALESPDAPTAVRRLEALAEGAYNPFNLVVADGRDAFVVGYERGPLVTKLAPGVHVIGNSDPATSAPKLARLRERARAAAHENRSDVLEALADLCREHAGAGGPLDDACVHTLRYGTRSSTLLQLGDRDSLRFADGPPCRTAYEDFSHLLLALGRPAAASAGEHLARMAP